MVTLPFCACLLLLWWVERYGFSPPSPQQDGCTSLVLASRNGRLDIVKFLVGKGANLEAANSVRRRAAGCDETRGHFREWWVCCRGRGAS